MMEWGKWMDFACFAPGEYEIVGGGWGSGIFGAGCVLRFQMYWFQRVMEIVVGGVFIRPSDGSICWNISFFFFGFFLRGTGVVCLLEEYSLGFRRMVGDIVAVMRGLNQVF